MSTSRYLRVAMTMLVVGVMSNALLPSAHAAYSAWKIETAAPFAGDNRLSSVTCAAANDCWATLVRNWDAGVEHWDGTAWSVVDTAAGVAGVSCLTADDCWAVSAPVYGTEVYQHWDGATWTVAPGTPSAWVTVPSCISTDDCWALNATNGTPAVVHWNGTNWTLGTFASKRKDLHFTDIDCPSANRCLGVGVVGGARGSLAYAEWNGTKWIYTREAQTSDRVYGDGLSLSCPRPNSCWVVARRWDTTAPSDGTALRHWDGTSWQAVEPIQVGESDTSYLYNVDCPGMANCWAAGMAYEIGTGWLPLIEHWNGTQWGTVSLPSLPGGQRPPYASESLRGISCAGGSTGSTCKTVGQYWNYDLGNVQGVVLSRGSG